MVKKTFQLGEDKMQRTIARLFALACIALGIIALIVGFADKTWQLGVVGWFTGGILLGVVAVLFMLDEFAENQRKQR